MGVVWDDTAAERARLAELRRGRRRHRWPWVVAVLALAGAVLAGRVLWAYRRPLVVAGAIVAGWVAFGR